MTSEAAGGGSMRAISSTAVPANIGDADGDGLADIAVGAYFGGAR